MDDGSIVLIVGLGAIALLLAFIFVKKYIKSRALVMPKGSPKEAKSWEVGPYINGESKSLNVPKHPKDSPAGPVIEFPYPNADAGHVHYVTFNPGSLKGKKRITMRYRIEADEGVKLHPPSDPTGAAMLLLFFQRCGDNWGAVDDYETYRWWSASSIHIPLVVGDHEISSDLDTDVWTAVLASNSVDNAAQFEAAKEKCCRVGFTLGGGDGYGHGVFATGPARFIIKDYIIE